MARIIIKATDQWDADSLAERICKGAAMLFDVEQAGRLGPQHEEPLERLDYLSHCYWVKTPRTEAMADAWLIEEIAA